MLRGVYAKNHAIVWKLKRGTRGTEQSSREARLMFPTISRTIYAPVGEYKDRIDGLRVINDYATKLCEVFYDVATRIKGSTSSKDPRASRPVNTIVGEQLSPGVGSDPHMPVRVFSTVLFNILVDFVDCMLRVGLELIEHGDLFLCGSQLHPFSYHTFSFGQFAR